MRLCDNSSRPTCVEMLSATGVVLFLAGLASPLLAASFRLQSVDTMTRRAQEIVRVLPSGTPPEVRWDPGRRYIYTETEFQVLESLYGDSKVGTTIWVRTLGGFIPEDDIGMVVPGAPAFRHDEEIILFLWRNPGGALRVLDLAAGKLEVSPMASGQRRLSRRDLRGADVVSTAKWPGSLEELRDHVSRAAARKANREQSRESREEPGETDRPKDRGEGIEPDRKTGGKGKSQ